MDSETDTLDNLLWINLPNDLDTDMGDFRLNPMIPLPIEPDENGEMNIEDVTWEKVIAATLLLLANSPAHDNADYYREFLQALRPELAAQLTDAANSRIEDGDWSHAEEIMLALRGMKPRQSEHKFSLARLYDRRAAHETKNGNSLIAENYTQAAKAAYGEILSNSPVPDSAWYFSGAFDYRNGDYLSALKSLETFLKKVKKSEYREDAQRMVHLCRVEGQADELYRKAYAALTEGNVEDGVKMAREFRDSRLDSWPGWFLLGWGLRLSEDWSAAREALEGAQERGCREGNLFNELAICTRALQDYEGAENALTEALKLDPDNTKIISNMAIIQLEKGSREEAMRWLETALTLDPADPICQKLLADLNGEEE